MGTGDRYPSPLALGQKSVGRRGQLTTQLHTAQTKLVVTHKKVKKLLQVPLGPPENYLGNFQAENEEFHVVAGDIA